MLVEVFRYFMRMRQVGRQRCRQVGFVCYNSLRLLGLRYLFSQLSHRRTSTAGDAAGSARFHCCLPAAAGWVQAGIGPLSRRT